MVRNRVLPVMRPRDFMVARAAVGGQTPAQALTALMLSHSPVLYIKNSDPVGTAPLVTDFSAGSHNMVGNNFDAGDWQVAGPDADIIPHAMRFDGVNEFSSVADDADFNVGTAMTAMCWIKIATANFKYFFNQLTLTTNNFGWYMASRTGGTINFVVYGNDSGSVTKSYRSSVVAADETYHHVAMTFGSSTLKVYVDGVEDTSVVKTVDDAMSSIFNSQSDVHIGKHGGGSNVTGDIAECALMPTALTGAQIAAIYTAGGGS